MARRSLATPAALFAVAIAACISLGTALSFVIGWRIPSRPTQKMAMQSMRASEQEAGISMESEFQARMEALRTKETRKKAVYEAAIEALNARSIQSTVEELWMEALRAKETRQKAVHEAAIEALSARGIQSTLEELWKAYPDLEDRAEALRKVAMEACPVAYEDSLEEAMAMCSALSLELARVEQVVLMRRDRYFLEWRAIQ